MENTTKIVDKQSLINLLDGFKDCYQIIKDDDGGITLPIRLKNSENDNIFLLTIEKNLIRVYTYYKKIGSEKVNTIGFLTQNGVNDICGTILKLEWYVSNKLKKGLHND